MQIKHIETVLATGAFAASREWAGVRAGLLDAVRKIHWPPDSDKFIIYPESGKKSGQGNGVKPIKLGLLAELVDGGWEADQHLPWPTTPKPGKFDAILRAPGPVVVEWETGNISSSHRAMNKVALALLKGVLKAGVLVVPTRDLYRYLTDRVGNWSELVPYIDLWRSVPVSDGVLEIVAVEQDGTSFEVPRIAKGTDGRALR